MSFIISPAPSLVLSTDGITCHHLGIIHGLLMMRSTELWIPDLVKAKEEVLNSMLFYPFQNGKDFAG